MTYILLVDDDRAALSTMANALADGDYQIERALSVEQARQKFFEHRPDLAILEVTLSQNTGWQLLDEWIDLGVRVIVLTRFHSGDALKRAFDAGATDVIGKPFAPDDLALRVATRLKQTTPHVLAYSAAPVADAAEVVAESKPLPELRLSLGEQLRIARKQRNISLVQANLETHIQMYYIQALEEDRYGLLPRGRDADEIVKTYAKFLGQNPQTLLAEFRSVHIDDDPGPRDLSGQPFRSPRLWPRFVMLLAIGVLACAAVSTVLWFMFPDQLSNAWTNSQSLFAAPTATLEVVPPTLEPSPTVVLETPSAVPESPEPVPPTSTLVLPSPEPSPVLEVTPTP